MVLLRDSISSHWEPLSDAIDSVYVQLNTVSIKFYFRLAFDVMTAWSDMCRGGMACPGLTHANDGKKTRAMDASDQKRRLAICGNLGRWCIIGSAAYLTFGLRAQEMSPRDFNFFGSEVLFPQFAPFYTRTPDPAQASSRYAHMLFFSGDRHLAGRLVELNEKEIVWQRPDTRELLHFPRQSVRRIVLADGPSDMESPVIPRAPEDVKSGALPATVKLGGGDWLFGALTSADGQTFTSQLDDRTSITIPRKQIEW